MLAFLLRNWQGIALSLLVGVAVLCFTISRDELGALKTAQAQRDDARAAAAQWQAFAGEQQKLAEATAQAHAAEVKDISNIKSAAVAAREGASHAPGADDRFAYSDAAYGFMRAPAAAGGAGSAATQAPAGVDKR